MEQMQIGKQIGNFLDMPERPQAPKPIFSLGGCKYNSLNSTFEIALKNGLDSEDADRRESIHRLIFSSFCRADEKLYNKQIFPPRMARSRKVFKPGKCLN